MFYKFGKKSDVFDVGREVTIYRHSVESISRQLFTLRKKHGYTLQDLSHLCDVSENYLWRIENMMVSPRVYTLNKILAVYNMRVVFGYEALDNV